MKVNRDDSYCAINVNKVSDKPTPAEPQKIDSMQLPVSEGFLATPGQLSRHKKPRDSFAVMRIRSKKHTVGITIPTK